MFFCNRALLTNIFVTTNLLLNIITIQAADFDPSNYEGSTDKFERCHRDGRKLTKEELEEYHKESSRGKNVVNQRQTNLRSGLHGAYGNTMGEIAILRHVHLHDETGITIHHKDVSLSGIGVYLDKFGMSVVSDLSDLKRHQSNHRSEEYVKLNDTTSWLGSVGHFGDIRKDHITNYSTGILHKLSDSVNITALVGERFYKLNTSKRINANHLSTLNSFSKVSIHWVINSQQRFGVSAVFETSVSKLSASRESHLFTYYQHDLFGNHLNLDTSIGVDLKTRSLEQFRIAFQLED